jgi:hypothetical protein
MQVMHAVQFAIRCWLVGLFQLSVASEISKRKKA